MAPIAICVYGTSYITYSTDAFLYGKLMVRNKFEIKASGSVDVNCIIFLCLAIVQRA